LDQQIIVYTLFPRNYIEPEETRLPNIIKKMLKKKKTQVAIGDETVQTTPLLDDALSHKGDDRPAYRPVQFLVGSAQSVGMQRDHNEDTLFSLSSVVGDGTNDIAFGIAIVADGMGGHKNGEIASGVAARFVAKNLVSKVLTRLLSIHNEPLEESLQEIMEGAINETQKAVMRFAPGGGTTFTCALITGEQVTIGHVGDSRAYFVFNDGRIQKITKDHSLVQRMVDLEEITEAEAAVHPQRNVLLKAIGHTESVYPDIQTFQVPKDGYMLLCSDGLWGVVPDTTIQRVLAKTLDPVLMCDELVIEANNKGGPDNISVILVRFYG
jgi:protein phosphatase